MNKKGSAARPCPLLYQASGSDPVPAAPPRLHEALPETATGAGRFISFARMLASLRRISGRRTIISIAPFSIRNSLRWNPGGSFSRTVCSITRGPAKPISAFWLGNVQIAQHRKARRYAAHGRVGQHGDVRQSALLHFRQRREVFAICISDISASCIRAPPEAEKQISGQLSSSACSTARTKRAPTTEPIEPP